MITSNNYKPKRRKRRRNMSAKDSAALAAATPSNREIVITREFDAPRELVWKAWTEPQHIMRWWGPRGFTTTIEEMDVRPRGAWRQTMHGPDGVDYPSRSAFTEVVKHERICFLHDGGKKGEPSSQFESTWAFEEVGEKTRVTIRMVFESAQERERVIKEFGAIEGGNQTLARLAEFLPKLAGKGKPSEASRSKTVLIAEPDKPTTILTRVFDAPRKLVYEAYTNPKHIQNWWGLRSTKIVVEKMDVRPGGAWRFVEHAADGKEFAFSGEFREIVPQERIVSTFEYEAMPGHVILNTTLFEEYEGKTKVTITSVYPSIEDREGMLRSGMEKGANESWDTLEELLAQMAGKPEDRAKQELVLTREFNAPRELVWKAWTDPKHLAQWWGPRGFTNPVCEVDVRPEGAMLIHMRAPDGTVYPMKAVFQEVVVPERLVFLSGAMDEAGNLLFEVLNTVTFAEQAGKTKLTMHARVTRTTAAAAPYLAGMEVGWTQSLERLEAFVTRN
jgi:uncharacterized protein YndB with AHSA1/START domain